MTGEESPGTRDEARTRISLYSRPNCHLCDDMKTLVSRVATGMGLAVEEVDITMDARLEARYGLEVPVLVVNGRKAAKYRITEGELVKILRGSPSRHA